MNGPDALALPDRIQYGRTAPAPARDHAAKDRVDAVQVRLRRMRDEILAAAGVGTRERHADRADIVAHGIDLIADREPWPAPSITPGIAVLHDEVRHHPMPARPVEIAASHEIEEHG